MSISMMSVVASRWAVLGCGPTGDRMTPPQATDVSRIEMRLLRDTRRVLEYLPKTFIDQQWCSARELDRDTTLMGTHSFPTTDVLYRR